MPMAHTSMTKWLTNWMLYYLVLVHRYLQCSSRHQTEGKAQDPLHQSPLCPPHQTLPSETCRRHGDQTRPQLPGRLIKGKRKGGREGRGGKEGGKEGGRGKERDKLCEHQRSDVVFLLILEFPLANVDRVGQVQTRDRYSLLFATCWKLHMYVRMYCIEN